MLGTTNIKFIVMKVTLLASTELLHNMLPKCHIQVFTHSSVRLMEGPCPRVYSVFIGSSIFEGSFMTGGMNSGLKRALQEYSVIKRLSNINALKILI